MYRRQIERSIACFLFVAVCVLFTLAQKDTSKLNKIYQQASVVQTQKLDVVTTAQR